MKHPLKSPIALCVALSGCSLVQQPVSIGGLHKPEVVESDLPMPTMYHRELRDEYTDLMGLVEDETLRKAIERRIADVHMMEGDFNQERGSTLPGNGNYGAAIDSYNHLLDKYPADAENADVLYQLAKAYELEGQEEKALETLGYITEVYSTSPRLAEVYFRLGDIYFKRQEYEIAERDYAQVIALGRESQYYNNAMYLMGWSRYKQSNYEGSLVAFDQVLNSLVPASGRLEGLDKPSKSLAEETLKITGLSLSYAGGAEKIQQLYQSGQSPRYAWLLYSSLGNLYLEKERYEDSAIAYRAFVEQEPTSDLAPQMHAKMIRAYVDGNFPKAVLPEKERYVENYGINSAYWQGRSAEARAEVLPSLKTYIDELARHYHSTGQNAEGQADKKQAAAQQVTLGKAVDFYQQYIATFPRDPKVPEMTYMAGEASFDSGNYLVAIDLYEKSAYELKDVKHGANAGYAAIIAYQKQLALDEEKAGEGSPQMQALQQRSVDSKLTFVQKYRADSRSASVMASTSEELFALKQYDRALEVAQSVMSQQGELDRGLADTAQGVIAMSYYETGQLQQAEQAYQKQLEYVDEKDERKRIQENIAAIAYKQGEAAIAEGGVEAAIDHFLRIKKLAPNSEVRIVAQYDAASHLIAAGSYGAAIAELNELHTAFPGNQFSTEISNKLAYAFENSGQFKQAADQYIVIYRKNPDADVKRDALFSAAECNKNAGNVDTAIEQYKRWAHQYEQPFSTRMEAKFNLASLYELKRDKDRHHYWLRRIIDAHENAGAQSNDRSLWMAAWANAKYGDYWSLEFNNVHLRNPLEKHLPRKQEKLKNAQSRYEKAAAYGVLEFTAKSSYSIAELYARFSRELMNSPKPSGLSTAEQQQYEMLLEEQAIPFEEMAIEIHQSNIERSWRGEFNHWIEKSFVAMATINPVRFDKQEMMVAYGKGIR